jgi:hypothetical protein
LAMNRSRDGFSPLGISQPQPLLGYFEPKFHLLGPFITDLHGINGP